MPPGIRPAPRGPKMVYLIGSGESALEVDTSKLINGYCIGINEAAFHKPCNGLFSNDHGWCLLSKDRILNFRGSRFLCIRNKYRDQFENWGVVIFSRVDLEYPSTAIGTLSSGPDVRLGCSGYVALNLAYHLGARRIVLFGYDFHDEYKYFHHPFSYPRVHIPDVRKSFKAVAPWYMERGIRILNANPKSSIDAFEKISLEEAYQWK